jgi:hypothetical protein
VTIQAVEAAQATCPGFCEAHLPADGGPVHISSEQVVELAEGNRAYVSLEQAPGQPVAVRLQGAADTPMSPTQAQQLIDALADLVLQASGGAA